MQVIIVMNGTSEEIAALVLEIQERREKGVNEWDLDCLRDSIAKAFTQTVGSTANRGIPSERPESP